MTGLDANRDATVVALYAGGATMQEIAEISGGISRERVRQLLKRNGVAGVYNSERIDPLRVIASCRRPGNHSWSMVARDVGHPSASHQMKQIATSIGMDVAIQRLFDWRWRKESARYRAEKRSELIADYRALSDRLGRPASSGELSPTNGTPFWVVFYKYFPDIQSIRIAAGFDPNDPRIVLRGKAVQTHCRRGHLLADTRTKWGYCGICRKDQDARRKAGL